MLNYYESKMKNTYAQWQACLDAGKQTEAKVYSEDYLNYKEMFDGVCKQVGNANE